MSFKYNEPYFSYPPFECAQPPHEIIVHSNLVVTQLRWIQEEIREVMEDHEQWLREYQREEEEYQANRRDLNTTTEIRQQDEYNKGTTIRSPPPQPKYDVHKAQDNHDAYAVLFNCDIDCTEWEDIDIEISAGELTILSNRVLNWEEEMVEIPDIVKT